MGDDPAWEARGASFDSYGESGGPRVDASPMEDIMEERSTARDGRKPRALSARYHRPSPPSSARGNRSAAPSRAAASPSPGPGGNATSMGAGAWSSSTVISPAEMNPRPRPASGSSTSRVLVPSPSPYRPSPYASGTMSFRSSYRPGTAPVRRPSAGLVRHSRRGPFGERPESAATTQSLPIQPTRPRGPAVKDLEAWAQRDNVDVREIEEGELGVIGAKLKRLKEEYARVAMRGMERDAKLERLRQDHSENQGRIIEADERHEAQVREMEDKERAIIKDTWDLRLDVTTFQVINKRLVGDLKASREGAEESRRRHRKGVAEYDDAFESLALARAERERARQEIEKERERTEERKLARSRNLALKEEAARVEGEQLKHVEEWVHKREAEELAKENALIQSQKEGRLKEYIADMEKNSAFLTEKSAKVYIRHLLRVTKSQTVEGIVQQFTRVHQSGERARALKVQAEGRRRDLRQGKEDAWSLLEDLKLNGLDGQAAAKKREAEARLDSVSLAQVRADKRVEHMSSELGKLVRVTGTIELGLVHLNRKIAETTGPPDRAFSQQDDGLKHVLARVATKRAEREEKREAAERDALEAIDERRGSAAGQSGRRGSVAGGGEGEAPSDGGEPDADPPKPDPEMEMFEKALGNLSHLFADLENLVDRTLEKAERTLGPTMGGLIMGRQRSRVAREDSFSAGEQRRGGVTFARGKSSKRSLTSVASRIRSESRKG